MKQIIYTISRNTYLASSFFWQDDAKIACVPGVKRQVVEMAINGSGIRDTSRVLGINKNTVISTLKKKTMLCLARETICFSKSALIQGIVIGADQ